MLRRSRVATVLVVVFAACSIATDPQTSVRVVPSVSASFEGQGVAHTLGFAIANRVDNGAAAKVTWSMATTTAGVTVDSAGVVSVAGSVVAGDYAVRVAIDGAVGSAVIRVLPRPVGYMVFVASVSGTDQVFIRDFSKDTSVQLTSGSGFIGGLAVDGVNRQIFFARGAPPSVDIYRVEYDGAALVNLTNDPASANQGPAIDPVTHNVLFSRRVSSIQQIVRMRPDGSVLTTITGGTQSKVNPAVSPDGTKLTWGELYQPGFNNEIVTARINGQDTLRFTNRLGTDGPSVWLSNSRILWSQLGSGAVPTDLFVATTPNGTDAVNVTNSAASEASPTPACTTSTFIFVTTSGASTYAVEATLGSSLLVKYGLGYKPSLVRRAC